MFHPQGLRLNDAPNLMNIFETGGGYPSSTKQWISHQSNGVICSTNPSRNRTVFWDIKCELKFDAVEKTTAIVRFPTKNILAFLFFSSTRRKVER